MATALAILWNTYQHVYEDHRANKRISHRAMQDALHSRPSMKLPITIRARKSL